MVNAYGTIKIGSPLDKDTLLGPLHSQNSVNDYIKGLETIKKQGGKILYGGKVIKDNYVMPTIVEISPDAEILQHELFMPIVYVMKFNNLQEAIKQNNNVP